MAKKIVANPKTCMSCGICEVSCSVQHSKFKDILLLEEAK